MNLHSREEKKKAGSALLVVLGFLSFMVVSAVAFAIYMRAERVPSSALRRNTATRHLVKAALAHAMSRVDDAIRNDPFPGAVNTNNPTAAANFYHDKGDNAMDVWFGRVFMPPNPDGLYDDNDNQVTAANDPGDLNTFAWRFAPVTKTVSVLNLEALGYIPPPLVNDVRFLSRSTWTAKWQNFPFDVGRFAFCAVNVSDYFDINRTTVGSRSSPLDSPVSLLGTLSAKAKDDGTYEFENITDGDVNNLSRFLGPNATRETYASVPYVSMLDYNLALGSQTIGPLASLFYPWIRNQGNGYFYGGTTRSSQGVQQAMRQPFITDSFSAESNTTYEIDFATLDGQPFSDIDMKGDVTVQQVAMATGSQCVKRMYDKGILGEADVFTFYDYLDHNDVPLSLAMPCVECVPMVTAVELVGQNLAKLKVTPGTPISDPATIPDKFTGTQTKKTPYKLDPSSFVTAAAGVRLLVAFPFRHFAGRNIDDFKVQVAMKVFVASGAVSARPADGLSGLHPKDKAEWNQQSKAFTVDGNAPGDALAWSLYSDKVNVSIPNECKTQDDAIMQIDVTRWNGSADVPGDQDFLTLITKQDYENGSAKGPPQPLYQLNLRPFKDGTLLDAGEQNGDLSTAPFAADQFRTYAMLWVRVTDSSGNETYDLAPAIVADDMLNDKNNNFAIINDIGGISPGGLLFGSDAARSYTYANVAAGTLTGLDGSDPNWQPKSLATVDPRYNYAPEDWFAWDQSVSPGAWLDKIADAGFFNIADGRDPDIFMFTSNQGYLQSLGEFAFLPRLSEWRDTPGSRISPLLVNAPGASATAKHADRPEEILNKTCAWRTYPVDRDFYEDCAMPIVGIGRSSGDVPAVNPYSDNDHILLAAFANTPCDYWTTGRTVAGMKQENLSDELAKIVNKMGDKNGTSGDEIKDAGECQKFAFCEKNTDSSARMEAKDVCAIMRSITSAIRSAGAAKSWEEAYDELFAEQLAAVNPKDDNTFKTFMGMTLNSCPLYSIDRKFLYSYWRDCFANKQQLFLIFVRAESTALGGSGEGTPAQQGGRAVALVWREPQSNRTDGGQDGANDDRQVNSFRSDRRPHRMRVLFYHQFD